jgi:hypothetical protein
MLLKNTKGTRSLVVADATVDYVICHIAQHPGFTVRDYADQTEVAEVAINLIIENWLMHMVNEGRIAVSHRGRRPDWYHLASNPQAIPVKVPNVPEPPECNAITDPTLRPDYSGIVQEFNHATRCKMSPAKRHEAVEKFVDRVNHIGGHHQEVVEHHARLLKQVMKLQQDVNLLASAITATTLVKEPI